MPGGRRPPPWGKGRRELLKKREFNLGWNKVKVVEPEKVEEPIAAYTRAWSCLVLRESACGRILLHLYSNFRRVEALKTCQIIYSSLVSGIVCFKRKRQKAMKVWTVDTN